jgi:predicted secreted hydrolase
MHDDLSEWWYWTGHLKTADGRWFGFQQAVFRHSVLGVRGTAAHTAVTDIDGNAFHHAVYQPLLDVSRTENGFDFAQAGQHVSGGDGHDTLHGQGLGFSFDLELEPVKRPTLQHEDGYIDYSFGGYTYYYSRERMAVSGTVVVGTESFAVTGTGWFDHQYGDLSRAISYGWDWLGIQLDDNREIMLFTVHAGGAPVVVGASLSDASCVTTELAPADFEVESLGTWTSPHTLCTYPSGWHVRVKDLELDIQPTVADQELFTSAFLTPIYWEGASTVTGSATGRAYVELSGYCPALP